MTLATHLSTALASRKVVLWVEDTLTREYLLRLWQPEDINFNILVGGGNNIIKAVVHDLRLEGHDNVFGLSDRDFGKDNKASWNNINLPIEVFRLPALEIENYLLDCPALAGCSENEKRLKLPHDFIAGTARAQAEQMTWWMACRMVIAQFQVQLMSDFPSHPKINNVKSLTEACDYIIKTSWHSDLLTRAKMVRTKRYLTENLNAFHTKYSTDLGNGDWTRTFSGKEIFTFVRSQIINNGSGTGSEQNTDLAASVADYQRHNNTTPADLADLLSALKLRTNIP